MKKITALFLTVVFLLSLTACGKSEEKEKEDVVATVSGGDEYDPFDDLDGDEPDDEDIDFEYIDWDTNPIDRLYNEYVERDEYSDMELNGIKTAMADLWENEAEHAYSLLADCTDQKEYKKDIEKAVKALHEYASLSAEIEMLAGTSYFSSPGEEPDEEDDFGGSDYGGDEKLIEADFYRNEALRVYDLITPFYKFKTAEDAFVFDRDKFIATAEKEYNLIFDN